MFSMILDQAVQECAHMEKQTAGLSDQILELEQAVKAVRGISGMEEPAARLEQLRRAMEQEYAGLHQMMLALNKSILNYQSCENRICDSGEQNVILYTKQGIEVNDFSDITNILSGI